jgi:hypothetical protein
MKKVLLILFVLAICILAFPHGVMAVGVGGAQNVPITAEYGVPTDFSVVSQTESSGWSWKLVANQLNFVPTVFAFHVQASADWDLWATDVSTGTHTDGYMQGSVKHLNNPFEMTTEPGRAWGNLLVPLKVRTEPSRTAPWDWNADIRQNVDDNDFGSSSGFTLTTAFTITAPF